MNGKRYLNIYEEVRSDIIAGRYRKGAKLPSKRVMAESMGVSVITVEHAYELLTEEGYISPREKSGYFVIFDDRDVYIPSTHIHETESPDFFADNVNRKSEAGKVEFSYSIYARTVRRVLSEYDSYILERSPQKGDLRFRKVLCDYLSRSRRISVTPEQIIIGAGAEYLYGLIVQTLGRNIAYGIESPSYQKIAKVYEAGGADIEMLKP